MRAKCFSKEDRVLMAERVRKNETGIQNKEFKVCRLPSMLHNMFTHCPLVVPSARGLDRPSGPQRHLDLREYNARSQRGPVDLPSHPQFTNGMPTGGLGAFSNIIIQAFGFTMLQTYLLAIAQGAIIMTFLFSSAWLSKKYNNKLLFAFVSI